MITLLVAAALAAPEVVLGAGLETTLNDPYLVRQGLRLSAAVAPWPWLEAGLMGAVHPRDTDDSLTLRTSNMLGMIEVSPGVSPIKARTAATLDVPALRIDVGDSSVAVGPSAQVGLVYTVDDADALGVDDDDVMYRATARQWHVAPGYGLMGELRGGALGLRLRAERTPYVEQTLGDTGLNRRMWWAAAELTWRP